MSISVLYSIYKGSNKCLRDLRGLIKNSPDEFANALKAEIKEKEVPECKARCPVDQGKLRDSIHETEVTRDGRKISINVVAGEPGSGAEEYALVQHEDPDLLHPNGGEWKFIEHPLKESAPYLPERIANRINLNRAKEGGE